ncbi:MAG TPA: hypothetical protein VIR31_04485 [Nitrososphaeraceae archaeon]
MTNPTPDEIKYYNEINPIWKKLGLHKISNWEALSEAFEKGEKKARDEILKRLKEWYNSDDGSKGLLFNDLIKELQSSNESKGDKSE